MKKAILSLALAFACTGVAAEDFPSRPLTLIVPYSAGGSSDTLARALGDVVSKEIGQSVIVENRPGAGTVIGAQGLLSKPADGHTALLVAASFVINPHTLKSLPYDTEKDFQPITQLVSNPHLLVVNNDLPASDLKEFTQWVKDNPNIGAFSSFGAGSSGHLGFELLKMHSGIDMLHAPYKGSAPATMAVLSGEVHATLGDVGVVAPHVQAGKLKAIAVTGDKRVETLPNVPTFAEAGLPQFSSQSWFGLLTHAEVSEDKVKRLNELFTTALSSEQVQTVLKQQAMEARPTTPEEFGEFMKAEGKKYETVIKEGNITLE
ncbi:tripartite tricarboxylate transporter substrate binding protein [Achromobacter sp. F4_2707]|uniref:Bug family tripartite tricarboxylate transporter substrate binding protein n=1 Tax=Achromobacter sp. F4_2707 TaxID=3114286 RepID=UPI0039C5CB55